jgi:proline iminopeptidase
VSGGSQALNSPTSETESRCPFRSKSPRVWGAILFLILVQTTLARTHVISPLSQGAHVAKINGVDIEYFIAGTGPMIVVQGPGWGLGSEYLRRGLAPLEAHFTLIFYDTRGSGQSTRPADESRMRTSDMIDDLECLRQFWQLPALVLMGHSHGGTIALGYAIRYPKHLKKLILVDSGINDFNFNALIKEQIEIRKKDKRFDDAIAAFTSTEAIRTDEQLQRFLAHIWPLYLADPDRYLSTLLASFSALPSSWVFNKHPEIDSSLKEDSLLGTVRVPTLIVAGRDDWICGPAVAGHLRDQITHSELRILKRAGHFPWIEDPREFFPLVAAFSNP